MSASIAKARRMQSAVDLFAGVFIAMLAWPFPIARAVLPAWLHVLLVLLACGIATAIYFVVALLLWNGTLGMRLAGLTLDHGAAVSRRSVVAVWAVLSASLALWYAVVPPALHRYDPAYRLTGLRLAETDHDARDDRV